MVCVAGWVGEVDCNRFVGRAVWGVGHFRASGGLLIVVLPYLAGWVFGVCVLIF